MPGVARAILSVQILILSVQMLILSVQILILRLVPVHARRCIERGDLTAGWRLHPGEAVHLGLNGGVTGGANGGANGGVNAGVNGGCQ